MRDNLSLRILATTLFLVFSATIVSPRFNLPTYQRMILLGIVGLLYLVALIRSPADERTSPPKGDDRLDSTTKDSNA